MKKILSLLLFTSLALPALADLPKKRPITGYTQLWTNSPFTVKPLVRPDEPEANPLEDYALGGVSPIPGGYRVTLLNRKKPDERIILPDNTDFKIISVQKAPGKPMDTTVRIATGSKQGNVAFDPTLLALKRPAAAPANANPGNPNPNPNQPPPGSGIPGAPAANGTPGNAPPAPRPRVLPAANNNPNPQVPGAVPTPQRPQIQRPNNIQRPTRR